MSGCCTGSDKDAWHNQDFLPLPMSESYKLPSRKNRTQPEDPQHRKDMLSHANPGRWAHDKHAEDDPEDDPAHPSLRQQPGRVKQALLDTGLDSTDDDVDEEGESDEQEGQRQQPQRKRKKSQEDGKESNKKHGAARQQDQGQGPSGNNPFGALVRGKAAEARSGGKPNRSAFSTLPCCSFALTSGFTACIAFNHRVGDMLPGYVCIRPHHIQLCA